MKITKFNEAWKFWVEKDAFSLVWSVPETAKTVNLPHDAMLEQEAYAGSPNGSSTGFRDGAVYHYVKMLKTEAREQSNTMLLKFEGVYMNAMVYVNGQLAAKCPFGYTGFYVPLKNYLRYGEDNEIRVIVRNSAMTNSRWYSGGGIYRDVYLLTAQEVFLEPEGVRAFTENLWKDAAALQVQARVKNESSLCRQLRLASEIQNQDGETVAAEEVPVIVFAGEARTVTRRLIAVSPYVWSAKTPYLYQIYTRLYEGEKLIDEHKDSFGIRTVSVDAKHGFLVNGNPVKLRGACIHHDSGILGASTFYDAEYRRVRRLKEAGFNAIRMAHHPAAPVLLRACDELGMYVMDETFDMWQRCKSNSDYALFFDEWWEKDVEAMVKKDFNHPCVVMYSIGNEIPEIATNQGTKICHDIAGKIKALDNTRFTLASINGVFAAGDVIPEIMGDMMAGAAARQEGNVNDFMTMMDSHMDEIVVHDRITERLDKACAYTDIAGYNYMAARYELDGRQRPNRVIVGSETYPPEIARNWRLVEKLDTVIGDFTWTGWDNIGEAGVGVPAYSAGEGGFGAGFPCQLSYCGDMDITGFRRPASYYREIVFGLRRDPYLAVQNPAQYGEKLIKTPWVLSDSAASWSYPGREGQNLVVEVYSKGEQVELLLNGKSLGRKEVAPNLITLFDILYEPGRLEAVSYSGGQELGRSALATAEGDTELAVSAEYGRNGELVYLEMSNQDKNGAVFTEKEICIDCRVEGAMQFWLGSGNPKPVYHYMGSKTETWHGRAQLVVRRAGSGKVKVVLSTGTQARELILE